MSKTGYVPGRKTGWRYKPERREHELYRCRSCATSYNANQVIRTTTYCPDADDIVPCYRCPFCDEIVWKRG